MNYEEKKVGEYGACEICGARILITSSRKKYCPECAEAMRRAAHLRGKDKYKAELMAVKRGLDLEKYKGTDKECRYKKSCIYGGRQFCEYMTITGHSRLLAGYPIKDGKCGAYRRGRTKRTKQPLPRSGSFTHDKLNEV